MRDFHGGRSLRLRACDERAFAEYVEQRLKLLEQFGSAARNDAELAFGGEIRAAEHMARDKLLSGGLMGFRQALDDVDAVGTHRHVDRAFR